MKKIIFLVLSFIIGNAQAQYEPLSFGKRFIHIDPKGTVNPSPGYAPTRLDLSAIDPLVAAGSILKIKQVGGMGFYSDQDNLFGNVLFVFVDQYGGYLQAGPKTTAELWHDYYSPLAWDYRIYTGQSVLVEVPQGAVAMLFSADDSYFYDNSDADGNWGVELSFSMIEKIDIYQVVKNPILNKQSTTIDLVAGKNADIVVKTVPNINIEGSFIEWKSADGLLTKTFDVKSGQTTSTASGDVTFYIDPVPTEAAFLNMGSSPIVHLKGKSNGQYVDCDQSSQSDLQVWPHKTKDIKLSFTALVGCTDDKPSAVPCFTPTTDQQVNDMITYGVPLTNAMFPVKEGGVTSSKESPSKVLGKKTLPIISNDKLSIIDGDLFTVDKNYFLNLIGLSSNNKINYTVGVPHQSYFKYRSEDPKDTTVGMAYEIPGVLNMPLKVKSLLVSEGHYYTLPHELGHMNGLIHSCDKENEICAYDKILDSYNNSIQLQNISSFDITRGNILSSDQTVGVELMRYGTGFQGFNPRIQPVYSKSFDKKWMSFDEYIKVFKNLIDDNKKEIRTLTPKLHITGIFDQNNLKLFNTYKYNDNFPYVLSFGDLLVKTKTIKNNELQSIFTKKASVSESKNQIVSFDLSWDNTAFFGDISDSVTGVSLSKFIIPTKLIEEEIKYIDRSMVKPGIDYYLLLKLMTDKIQMAESAILNQSYGAAITYLNDFISLINYGLNSRGKSITNSVLVDKAKFLNIVNESNNIITSSVANANIVNNVFIDFKLSEERKIHKKSKVEIKFPKKPTNTNMLFVTEGKFNDIEVDFTESSTASYFETTIKNIGLNIWKVRPCLVPRKEYQNTKSAIAKYNSEIAKLKTDLEKETDPVLKQEIQNQINQKQKNIIGLKSSLDASKIYMGSEVQVTFDGVN